MVVCIIGIAQLPIVLHILRAPQGYYFPFLDKIAFSDYYYPSLIKYGMGSNWLVQIPYVIAPHPPSIIQIFFIFLGKFAVIFHFDAFLTLAIWRVIGGLILLTAVIYFIHVNIPKDKRRIVFILFLCAEPLSLFYNIWSDHYEVWIWHFGEAARRISSMPPHYTVGKGLMVATFAMWLHFLQTRKKKLFASSIFTSFVGAIIYPPPFFILLASICGGTALYMFLHTIRGVIKTRQFIFKKFSIPAVFFIGILLIPMILLKTELTKGYPWNMWNKVELGWNAPTIPFEFEYVRQLGVLFFLLPIVCVDFLRRPGRRLRDYWILFWAGSAFVFFPFANIMSLGKFRFTEGIQILPLAIVALWGAQLIHQGLNRAVGYRLSTFIRRVTVVLFIGYFCLITFLVCKDSYISLSGLFRNVYMYPDEYQTLLYLDSHIKNYPVIIADVYSANFLPAFASVRTALGFPDFFESYNAFLEVNDKTEKFLKQLLPKDEAIRFLKSQNAEYVYYPVYAYGQSTLYPEILDKISGNTSIEIYRVKKGII